MPNNLSHHKWYLAGNEKSKAQSSDKCNTSPHPVLTLAQ